MKDKSFTLTGYGQHFSLAYLLILSHIIIDSIVFFLSTVYVIMHVSCEVFNTLIAPSGPDILISFYHECLHSIAFTHATILSIPHHKFIDPNLSANDNGTMMLQQMNLLLRTGRIQLFQRKGNNEGIQSIDA